MPPTISLSSDIVSPFSDLQTDIVHHPAPLRAVISAACQRDERQAVHYLFTQIQPDTISHQEAVRTLARDLVQTVRAQRTHASGVDALMHEFSLSSAEGIALMCLAEALLRIPDRATANQLIADKISQGDWRKHVGESPSLFVNAATWGLLITGKLVGTTSEQGLSSALNQLIKKGGEPLIRQGVDLAMRMLGNQFVTGQTIGTALANSRDNEARGYRYSYDMLGEGALTDSDAIRYYAAYENALHVIGRSANGRGIKHGPGMSVKLSALHPRYTRAQRGRVLDELLPRLKKLLLLARQYNIGLNIDAEEADRLELSLDLVEALAFDTDLAGFDGMGIVVQAYQKRCPFVIDYLTDLARRSGRKFMVRLVKGAYWDTEIKRAQVDGLSGYPVYTRKVYTDVSYLVCAQKLLAATEVIYPQFATHNAHTLASIYTWAQERNVTDYEFQCLHGMGETLYDQVVGAAHLDRPCRIYAPVGSHRTLLAYLVRRLLENGANSSFVNQIVDEKISLDTLIADPFDMAKQLAGAPHPRIPLPCDLYGEARQNSVGINWSNEAALCDFSAEFMPYGRQQWQAGPLLEKAVSATQAQAVFNPADRRDIPGYVIDANTEDVDTALTAAVAYALDWQTTAPIERAAMLCRAADLFTVRQCELMALAVREAGKSLPNALAEVREAVDFLRYYAAQIRTLPNTLALGPVVCISPWNFPLAILIGEVSAALAAGNVVLVKPAEQTPLIAYRAVQLLHEAGIPRAALQFLPGRGEIIGAALTADARVHGVIFTGSTAVAQQINRTLAQRAVTESCDIVLIAETGGQNAMIVDSSALPEQVVQDVLTSAFDSAGQRCSALRVLCLQEEIADKMLEMLQGAMQELRIGNPGQLATDIGPVIDAEAQQNLLAHIDHFNMAAKRYYQLPLFNAAHPDKYAWGTFVAPTLLEISSLTELQHEVFGPVLHVIRYSRQQLPALIDAINATGYGLTLGIHSRLDDTINFITAHAHVGNIYVNRNIVGAVVGVQPFGGEGKSGTGPKAGGPLYLKRLQHHPVITLDTYALSGRTKQLPGLDALLAWFHTHGVDHLLTLGQHYAQTMLLDTTIVMPGPTGERNTLSFRPRGIVLCAAVSLGVLLNQFAAVLATGNTIAVTADISKLIPVDMPQIVRDRIQEIDHVESSSMPLAIALVQVSQRDIWHPLLAMRDGALVPVIETTEESEIPLWRLLAERALCVNMTAAGGNASLMTLAS